VQSDLCNAEVKEVVALSQSQESYEKQIQASRELAQGSNAILIVPQENALPEPCIFGGQSLATSPFITLTSTSDVIVIQPTLNPVWLNQSHLNEQPSNHSEVDAGQTISWPAPATNPAGSQLEIAGGQSCFNKDSMDSTPLPFGVISGDETQAEKGAEPPVVNQAQSISPTTMDPSIQHQGKELQEMVCLLWQTTTEPLSQAILNTPKHKKQTNEDEPIQKLKREFKQRKSPMLQAKSSDKSVIKLAQDLVPKKCGII
jgi:hypothetical protein